MNNDAIAMLQKALLELRALPPSRPRSLAITKTEEAIFWLSELAEHIGR